MLRRGAAGALRGALRRRAGPHRAGDHRHRACPTRCAPTTSRSSASSACSRVSELRLRGRADADSDAGRRRRWPAPRACSSAAATSPGCAPWSARGPPTCCASGWPAAWSWPGPAPAPPRWASVMILGGNGAGVSAAAVRTGPGLGLVPKSLIDMHFGERGRLPRLLSAVALRPRSAGHRHRREHRDPGRGQPASRCSAPAWRPSWTPRTPPSCTPRPGVRPHHPVRRAAAPAARRRPVRLRHPDPGHRARARPVLTSTAGQPDPRAPVRKPTCASSTCAI